MVEIRVLRTSAKLYYKSMKCLTHNTTLNTVEIKREGSSLYVTSPDVFYGFYDRFKVLSENERLTRSFRWIGHLGNKFLFKLKYVQSGIEKISKVLLFSLILLLLPNVS